MENFRNIASTFWGWPLFSVGPVRSKLTVPFHLLGPFSISVLHCPLLSISVSSTPICINKLHSCVMQFWLSKHSISRETFVCSFHYSIVLFEDLWTQPAHIWEQSAHNNPGKISTQETALTISLIKSNLSSNSNTTNSDPTSAILNERETSFESGMERDLPDPSRPIYPQEIFEPQPG